MSIKPEPFAPYDTADYLTDIDDVVAYLEAALEETDDDPTVIAHALDTIARSRSAARNVRIEATMIR